MAITDAFNGSNGDNLVGHLTSAGGSWTYNGQAGGSFSIQSNKAKGAQFFGNRAYVDGTFPNNQFAECVTKAIAPSDTGGVVVRSVIEVRIADDGAGNAVAGVYENGVFFMGPYATGKLSNVLMTVRATITGTSLTITIDGGADITGGVVTGLATASGNPGILATWSGTDPTIDDFQCTDATVGGAATKRVSRITLMGCS